MSASRMPTRGALGGQRQRQVDGRRALAHAALARGHGDDVLHLGQQLHAALHRVGDDLACVRLTLTLSTPGTRARGGDQRLAQRRRSGSWPGSRVRRRRPRRRPRPSGSCTCLVETKSLPVFGIDDALQGVEQTADSVRRHGVRACAERGAQSSAEQPAARALPAGRPRIPLPASLATMTRKLFVTTALPYANAPFHIGHMMEYIQADIWVRFQRMQGHEVHFVCADDAHGAPIMIAAEKAGKTPQALRRRDRRRPQAVPRRLSHRASTTGTRPTGPRTTSWRRTSTARCASRA